MGACLLMQGLGYFLFLRARLRVSHFREERGAQIVMGVV
jgi:hypothetical protein